MVQFLYSMIAVVLKISQPCRFVFRWLSAGFCFEAGNAATAATRLQAGGEDASSETIGRSTFSVPRGHSLSIASSVARVR
jgi:hypothetical protein